MGYYNLWLPVFKQGDDLSHYLNENGTNGADAFLEMAKQYEDAAEICKKVADCISKSKSDITIDACTHHIGISARKTSVKTLLSQNIISEDIIE